MKELEKQYINQNKIEVNVKKQQEIEHVLEGTIKPKNGHFIWEINVADGSIQKASYKSDTVSFTNKMKRESERLIVKPDCVYIPALNKENALKKYRKDNRQSSYYVKAALLNLSDISF